MRRASLGSINYDLTINTPLPSRDAIMGKKHNKLQLSKILSTDSFGERVTVESASNGVFNHDEADITMISYLLMVAETDTRAIRILSDDTDKFALLMYWMYRKKNPGRSANGAVGWIRLGHQCHLFSTRH